MNDPQKPTTDADGRQCTCHPGDNPPRPCPRRFALSECREHSKQPTAEDIDRCEELARDRKMSSFTSAFFENIEPEDTEDFAQHLALCRLIEWARLTCV